MEKINKFEKIDTSKLFELRNQTPQTLSKASEAGGPESDKINSLKILKELKEEPKTDSLGTIKLTQQQKRFEQETRAYETYQKNIKEAGAIRTEMLKGIAKGENPYSLILKACKAISLMTGDTLFCDEMERNVIAICGEGFREEQALELKLEGVNKRIKNLEEATKSAINEKDLRRIKGALKAHEKSKRNIEKMIAKAGETH